MGNGMNSTSRLGAVLVVCGTVCVLAALVAVMFAANLQVQTIARGGPFVGVPTWAFAGIGLTAFAGAFMLLIGVLVSIWPSNKNG